MIDFNVADAAARLRVISVFQPGNASGIVTDPRLYRRDAPGRPQGYNAPIVRPYKRAVLHTTAGRNSLRFLALWDEPENFACIPYLVPTVFSDQFADNWTVYKLIPDDARCYHVGDMEWNGEQESSASGLGWHTDSWGFEIENISDFGHEIEDRQYIKAALIYAYDCAVWKWQDYNVFEHSTIAVPHTNSGGRRTDPQAGLFRPSLFWGCVNKIRAEWPYGAHPALWSGGR